MDESMFVERRGVTAVGTTEGIPAGTMLTVPAAPPTGSSGTAPVVAVNNVSKWEDPTFLISGALSFLLIIADPLMTALLAEKFEWKTFIIGCVSAVVAWSRARTNSVTK